MRREVNEALSFPDSSQHRGPIPFFLCLLAVGALSLSAAVAAIPAQQPDSLARPTLRASVRQAPIRIDGKLEDVEWAQADVAREFVQRQPQPNAAASQPTEARIFYDEAAVYVAVRMFDSHPDSIAAQLGRRDADDLYSDVIDVGIDSYLDRRTAFRFTLTPRGIQGDAILYDDTEEDELWDAVWEGAAHVDSLGWTAEFRIPLSQLRYGRATDARDRKWGVQFCRELARRDETSCWSPMPPDFRGVVSRFGDLVGLDSLATPTRLEVTPYVSSQVTRAPGERTDPFWEPTDAEARVGADVRYGLPKGFTLTATVNPDFGQVEVDPAVVNLSAFEVSFPERRPFFLEGIDIFRFGGTITFNDNNPSNFFYTRRIGRAPRRQLSSLGATFVDVPVQSDILAAAKVSGKTNGGLSVGVLGASTRRETGRYLDGAGNIGQAVVEPRTEYLVTRVRQDLRQGNTVLGGVFTGVRRALDDPALTSLLSREAHVGGVDWEHFWGDREWVVSGFLAGTRVAGDRRVMTALQRSSTRLFQRPDADHLSLDTTRTSLGGYFGTLSLARTAGRHWLGSATYEQTSPGFEVNDLGFQTRADARSFSTALMYRENEPGRLLRSFESSIQTTEAGNFDGDLLERRFSATAEGRLQNFWEVDLIGSYQAESRDDRLTRGGPMAVRPASWRMDASIESDSRRAVQGDLDLEWSNDRAGQWSQEVSVEVAVRPSSAAQISIGPTYSRQLRLDQYITSVDDPLATATFGRRHVFGDIEQRELSIETRANWTFSPTLTLQLWAQPFISTGRFRGYKEFRAPRTFAFDRYGIDRGTIERDRSTGEVTVDPDGGGAAPAFTFDDEDFVVRSLRGNAVVRWEYRPGSTLFVVWQQQRDGFDASGDLGAVGRVRSVLDDPAHNVFLVKLSFWIGR
jgi:hypothetical protein